MEPCDTPARISTQDEQWPFETALYFLLINKSISVLVVKSPHIPF